MAQPRNIRTRLRVQYHSDAEKARALTNDSSATTPRATRGEQRIEKRCPKCRSFTLSRHYFTHRCGMPGPIPPGVSIPAPGRCPTCGKPIVFYRLFICHNCCYVLAQTMT